MAISKIKAVFQNDVQTVWNIVTSLENYKWRSDLSKIEILNEKQFIEYTKDGYATTFTITVQEPYKRWEFDMENSNMKGQWTGIFTEKDGQTEIDFTEDVTAKKLIMRPFVKAFLKKQQAIFVSDLRRELEKQHMTSVEIISALKAKMKTNLVIGVFSSSSPISATVPVRYNRGKEYLTSKGFRIIDGRLLGKQDYYRSGSIKERADEFNQLLYNDEVQVLMAAIGGNNTNSILPYIDYEYLKKHPKIIIGYSDTTALLLGIYAKTGLITFYGPALASSFGEFPPFVDMTFAHFKTILCDDFPLPYEYKMPSVWTDEFINWSQQDRGKAEYTNSWVSVNPGNCRGRLIGGNLNTMEGFFGTEYMPEIKAGDILFIEDSLKDACAIERTFSLLKLAGIFDKVGGIILGKHEKFDDNGTGRKPYEILLEVLDGYNIPFLAEFDCCHTHPMFTMPIGCRVELDATYKRITLLERPLE